MKSLTGLGTPFLYLETPEMPMHVGSFNLCALPAGFKGSFHKAVIQHIGKRMHQAPVFSRKLVFIPLDLGHPLWVESDLKIGKMIGSVFSSSLGQLMKTAKSLPSAVTTFGSTLAQQSTASSAEGLKAKMPMKLAPATPFNAGITTDFVFVMASVPQAECKAMGKAVGGSFSDIVLWFCSAVKVKSSMQSLKGLLPTDYPSLLAPWLVGGAAKMAMNANGKSGIATRLPMVANLVISNVPGTPVPLHLAGAEFLSFHGLSIMHGWGL